MMSSLTTSRLSVRHRAPFSLCICVVFCTVRLDKIIIAALLPLDYAYRCLLATVSIGECNELRNSSRQANKRAPTSDQAAWMVRVASFPHFSFSFFYQGILQEDDVVVVVSTHHITSAAW